MLNLSLLSIGFQIGLTGNVTYFRNNSCIMDIKSKDAVITDILGIDEKYDTLEALEARYSL